MRISLAKIKFVIFRWLYLSVFIFVLRGVPVVSRFVVSVWLK